MRKEKLRILLTNTLAREGGAEQVASSLLLGFLERGHGAWLAVGVNNSLAPNVVLVDNTRTSNLWSRFWWSIHKRTTQIHSKFGRWGERIRRGLALMAEPLGILETLRGYENSHYPGTYQLLNLLPQRPDILHLHSLQRGYFELESLPYLSKQVPTVLTLHDAWLLSGHCTHPFGCDRWLTGCGRCPDLSIPPAILRDETARNWQRKKRVFAQSRLWIAADSHWLMEKVRASMLTYVDARVIYPGIDLRVFSTRNRKEARHKLNLPPHLRILLFVATKARSNPWKDYQLLKRVAGQVRSLMGDHVILLVVGDPLSGELAEEDDVWFAPPTIQPEQLALYYSAADIYVHATHVETFGLTIVEAMASGIPVIATRIAAIPELVVDGRTGYLTPPGDSTDMANRIVEILNNNDLQQSLGNAALEFAKRFDVNRTVEAYLQWYYEILAEDRESQGPMQMYRSTHWTQESS